MKKFKVVLALLLVAALCLTLFAACAKSETDAPKTDSTPSTSDKTDSTPAKTDEPAKTEEPDEPEDTPPEEKSLIFEEGEIIDIKMYMFDLRMTAGDHGERIEKAINEYLEPTYGLHVDIDFFTIGDWLSKVMVALAGGERCDFMPFLFTQSVTNMVMQNMAMPIEDLVDQYAPEAKEIMADFIDAYRMNGHLYGFPTLKNWVVNGYIVMRKDILEELGMLELGQNLDNLADYEKIMAAVHDNYTSSTGLYALAKEASRATMPGYLWPTDNFSDIIMYEAAGDGTGMAMVLDDGSNEIKWLMDEPLFEEKLQRVAGWREKGWIYPESSLTDTHGDELMKQGVSFSEFTGSEIGIEVTKGANVGKEIVCPKYYNGKVTTSNVQAWGEGVPVTAEEPEAAVYFMNALFTDAKLMNLFIWGEEGVDYDLVDGQVKTRENQYYEADFFLGNNLLLTPLYGNGVDHYEKVAKDIAEAGRSMHMGFSLDTKELQDAIANITAVTDAYTPDLYTGNYTPELFSEFKGALETAGVHDYLAKVQEQLDAWLATR